MLAQQQIEPMIWPPYSPDLNPIENVWHIMKHRLLPFTFKNRKELIAKTVEIWNNLEPDMISRVIASMPARVK